jgi:hypothetical protein
MSPVLADDDIGRHTASLNCLPKGVHAVTIGQPPTVPL